MDSLLSNAAVVLLQLLTNYNNVSSLLLEFLTQADIRALLSLNKQMRQNILRKPRFVNKLYYSMAFEADKSMYFGFYYEPEVQLHQRRKLIALYQEERLDWSVQLGKLNFFSSRLEDCLSELVPDHTQQIIKDIQRALREPEFPMPRLRHQTIGTYCNSSFQVLLAQLNWSGKARQDEWELEPYLELRKKIVDYADCFKQEFQVLDPYFLKTLRYKLDTISAYTKTPCALINIIQLVVLIVNNHLEGLVNYFCFLTNSDTAEGGLTASTSSTVSCLSTGVIMTKGLKDQLATPHNNSECPVQFLAEFVVRYKMFRNTATELEEKLGFVFKHYNLLFELIFPEYSLHPSFNLWRFMHKMWISKMRRFHTHTNFVYTYLMLSLTQSNIHSIIQGQSDTDHSDNDQKDTESPDKSTHSPNQLPIFTNHLQYQYMKQKKPYSTKYIQRFLGKAKPQSIFCKSDPQCESQLFGEYTEYTVDISINEYNVHWCGSSNQRLGKEYLFTERQLNLAYNEYLRDSYDTFESIAAIKSIFQSTLVFLNQKLKPPTIAKFIKQGTELLTGYRENRLKQLQGKCCGIAPELKEVELAMLKEWKLSVPDLSKNNLIIEYLNQQRQLAQQTAEEFAMCFDMDKQINLEVLESWVREHSELDSQQQLQYLQSYVSNDSTDHHQLQEPPQLTLGRNHSAI